MREDLRLPASYANFYIANECVLLPTFNDPNDAAAASTLQEVFPSRRIVPIDCTELIWGLGAFHCLTQQQPAVIEKRPRFEKHVIPSRIDRDRDQGGAPTSQ